MKIFRSNSESNPNRISWTQIVSNHLYFHTPSESPLNKGGSRDVKNKK